MDEELFSVNTFSDEQNVESNNIRLQSDQDLLKLRKMLTKKRRRTNKTFKTILENQALPALLLNIRQYKFDCSILNSIGLKLTVTKRFGVPLTKFSTPYLLFHTVPLTANSTVGTVYSQSSLQSGLLFYPWHDNFLKLNVSPLSITNHERWNYNYTVENSMDIQDYSIQFYLGFRVQHLNDEFGLKTILYVKTSFSTESTIDISALNIKYISVISENVYDTVIDELDYEDISTSGLPLYSTQSFAPRYYYKAGSSISETISTKIPRLYGEIADQTITISGISRTYSIVSLVQFIPNNKINNSVPYYTDPDGTKTYVINVPKPQSLTENSLYNVTFFVDERPFLNLMNNVASTDNFIVPQNWVPNNIFTYSDSISFNSTFCTVKNGIITINGKVYTHPVFIYRINKNYTAFYTEVVPYKQRSFGTSGNYSESLIEDISVAISNLNASTSSQIDLGGYSCNESLYGSNSQGFIGFITTKDSFFQLNFKLSKVKNGTSGTILSDFEDVSFFPDKLALRWAPRSYFIIVLTADGSSPYFPKGYTPLMNKPTILFNNNTNSLDGQYVNFVSGDIQRQGIVAVFFMVPAGDTLISYLQISSLSSDQRATFKLGESSLDNQSSTSAGPCDLFFKLERNPLDNTEAKLLIYSDLTSYSIDTGFIFTGITPSWTGLRSKKAILNYRSLTGTGSTQMKLTSINDGDIPTDLSNIGWCRYIPVERPVDKYICFDNTDRLNFSNYTITVSELYKYYPLATSKTDIYSNGILVGHNWDEWCNFRREYFPFNVSRTDQLCVFVPDYTTSMPIRVPWIYNDTISTRKTSYMIIVPKMSGTVSYNYIQRLIDINYVVSNNNVAYVAIDVDGKIDILTSIGCVVIRFTGAIDTEVRATTAISSSIKDVSPWFEVFWQESGVLVSSEHLTPIRGNQFIVTPDGFLCDGETFSPIGPRFSNGIVFGTLIVANSSFILPKHNPFVDVTLNKFPVGRSPGFMSTDVTVNPNNYVDIDGIRFPNRKSDGTNNRTMFGIWSGSTYMGPVNLVNSGCSMQLCPLDNSFSGAGAMFYDIFVAWHSTGDSQDIQVDEYLRKNCCVSSFTHYSTSSSAVFIPSYTGFYWGRDANDLSRYSTANSINITDGTSVVNFSYNKFLTKTGLTTGIVMPYAEFNGSTDLLNTINMTGVSGVSGLNTFVSFTFLSLFRSRIRSLIKGINSSASTGRNLIIGKFDLGSGSAVEEVPIIGETLKGFTNDAYGSSSHLLNGISSTLRVKVISLQITRLLDKGTNGGLYTQFILPTSKPIFMHGFNKSTSGVATKEAPFYTPYPYSSSTRPVITFANNPPVPLAVYQKASPSVFMSDLAGASPITTNGVSTLKNFRTSVATKLPSELLFTSNRISETPIYLKTSAGYHNSASLSAGIYLDTYFNLTTDTTFNANVV